MNFNKKLFVICYGITAFIFLAILLWGIFGLNTGDEMGYSALNFYLLMPITSLVMGLILGVKNAYLKWLYPALFGSLGFILRVMVFKGSGNWISLFFSMIPALLGLIIGLLIRRRGSGNQK